MAIALTPGDAACYGAMLFLAGVFFAGIGLHAYLVFALAAAFIFCAALFGVWPARTLLLLSLFLFFGMFYYSLYSSASEARQKIIFDKPVHFSGIVSEEPQPGERFQKAELALQLPLAGRVAMFAAPFPELNYGDVVEGDGVIKPAPTRTGMPTISFPKFSATNRHQGFWLKEKLIGFKHALIAPFKTSLPDDEAAFLAGVTLGWQGDFTKEFKTEMSLSGTTHLVALSGYNITILVVTVAALFGRFLSRRITFFLTGLFIFLFVLMVGAQASVVRAALMGFLALLAKETGRLYRFRNAAVLTAGAMVFINPDSLFDIGFALSFASLLGIVYLGPALKRIFRMEDGSQSFLSWRENGITTLSAQLAVAPLLIQAFGQFSLTGIAANILILEFVPLTMLLGFLLAGAGILFHYLGALIALPVELLLRYEIGVIHLFSHVRLPIALNPNSWMLFAAYYAILFVFAMYQYERSAEKV